MTTEYFNLLDETEQLNLVFNFGVDIAQRTTEEHHITLFQLFSFYVEVYTSGEKCLCEIRGFDDTQFLDIYLSEIDLVAMFGE